jgi:hypothetical protein
MGYGFCMEDNPEDEVAVQLGVAGNGRPDGSDAKSAAADFAELDKDDSGTASLAALVPASLRESPYP